MNGKRTFSSSKFIHCWMFLPADSTPAAASFLCTSVVVVISLIMPLEMLCLAQDWLPPSLFLPFLPCLCHEEKFGSHWKGEASDDAAHVFLHLQHQDLSASDQNVREEKEMMEGHISRCNRWWGARGEIRDGEKSSSLEVGNILFFINEVSVLHDRTKCWL